MIDASEALELAKKAQLEYKTKRLEEAEHRYSHILLELENRIRQTSSEGAAMLTLPIHGWPHNVDFKALGELLQESYHYKCTILEQLGEPTGLAISWQD